MRKSIMFLAAFVVMLLAGGNPNRPSTILLGWHAPHPLGARKSTPA